ncbi:MAG TPA: hypothetical protein VNB49_05380 [Candidatus Dormibacteraeota bacterium]|nr:hypothetical protein [Candidatus Dormibacteraeota bacterium]
MSIGAIVLFVALALPFFLLTRAEQLHHLVRAEPLQAVSTHTPLDQAGRKSDSAGIGASTAAAAGETRRLPLTAGTGYSAGRHHPASPSPAAPSGVTPSPSSAPNSHTPAVGEPLAILTVRPPSGSTPLTVTADASASADNPSSPIVNVLIDCGTGTGPSEMSKPWITSCTYKSSGIYTITVFVYDIDTKSSRASATITVS